MNHRILYIYFESILGHLYPQKTPENQSFFDIFRRCRIFGLKWVNVFWCYLRMKIKISNSLRLRKIIFVLSKRIKLEVLVSLSSRAFNVRKMNTLKGFKGIVKRAEPCKCDILIVSRILRHRRITHSLKEWIFSYLILTGDFPPKLLRTSLRSAIRVKAACFDRKNLWSRVLKANKKQVPLKNYSLKIRIHSVNQTLKIKEKVT